MPELYLFTLEPLHRARIDDPHRIRRIVSRLEYHFQTRPFGALEALIQLN